MKCLLAFFCMSSLLYAELPEEIRIESGELSFPTENSQEISLFDPSLTLQQQPTSFQELQPPPSILAPKRKSPFLAVGLSYLIPGLGHVYLGDMKTAGGLLGTTCLGFGLALSSPSNTLLPGIITLQNTSFYSIYAAYRDVRIYNGQAGYSYKMPMDSLADLTTAPFRFSILRKPEVWGGFLGAVTVAAATVYFAFPKEAHIQLSQSPNIGSLPFLALPIGIGEESFFRGFLQSRFLETYSPAVGITLSSLLFGASHIPNAMALESEHRWRYYTFSLPMITAMGAYLGWLTHKNRSLKESVALHSWYDFALFSATVLASQAAAIGPSRFAIAIPF